MTGQPQCRDCQNAINEVVKVSFMCKETMYHGIGCNHGPNDACQFKPSRFNSRPAPTSDTLDVISKLERIRGSMKVIELHRSSEYAEVHEQITELIIELRKRKLRSLPVQSAPNLPSRSDLIEFAKWSQTLYLKGQEIMRREGLEIDNLDDKMQKLAFTFYTDLCEIDQKVAHLFEEGWGDKNDRYQTELLKKNDNKK